MMFVIYKLLLLLFLLHFSIIVAEIIFHNVTGMALYGDYLVSGNADSTIRVWNIKDGACVHTLAGHHKHESAVTS
jgi:WD40 repeat protein